MIPVLFAVASVALPPYVPEVASRWDGFGLDVTVRAEKCGMENAWYDVEVREVVLCSELFNRPALTRFVLNHELAHAFNDQAGIPWVDAEVAADELGFLMSEEDEVIAAAKWFMTMGDVEYDEHPSGLDRAGSLLCLASARWDTPSRECKVYLRSVLGHWVRWVTLTLQP